MPRLENPAPYEAIVDVESHEETPSRMGRSTRGPSVVSLGARLVATVAVGAFLVLIGTAAVTSKSTSFAASSVTRLDAVLPNQVRVTDPSPSEAAYEGDLEISSEADIYTQPTSWVQVRSKVTKFSTLSDELKRAEFVRYKQTFGRTYPTTEEEEKRFGIFTQNLVKIDTLNAKSATAAYSINELADLNDEEFAHYMLGYDSTRSTEGLPGEVADWSVDDVDMCPACKRFPKHWKYELNDTYDNLPTDFSWVKAGAVTRVKNQGACGSCWSFSTTGDVEGGWYLSGNKLEPFSEQQLVACDTSLNAGCNGGLPLLAMMYIQNAGGLVTEAVYGYKKVNQYEITVDAPTCNTTVVQKKNYKAHLRYWQRVSYAAATEDDLRMALLRLGPLSIALDATSMRYYSGGVDDASDCSTTLNHAVLLVGYGEDDGESYWTIKNSWGYLWGESGYYRLKRGANKCGMATEVVHGLA